MKKNIPLYILFIIFIILSIFDTEKLTNSALDAISLWGLQVFPALFPFLFCTKALLLLGVAPFFEKILGGVFELLGLPKKGAYPFCVSLLGGYPSGAATLGQMTRLGMLNEEQCSALAPLCHTSGPIFILGYASRVTRYDGVMLLLCHLGGVIACALTVRLVSLLLTNAPLRESRAKYKASASLERSAKKERSAVSDRSAKNECSAVSACSAKRGDADASGSIVLGELLVKACDQSISTMLTVGGFIIFFACFTAFLPIPDALKGLFEMTNGLKMGFSAPICAFLLSFSGLCINFQALALLPKNIKPMQFIGCRLLSGVFSAIFCAISQACSIYIAVSVILVLIISLAGGIIWRTGRGCALPARRSLQDRSPALQERR